MSWKDRAILAEPDTSKEKPDEAGSWRERAIPVDAVPESKNFGEKVLSDAKDLAVGTAASVKKGAYDLPKAATESLAQTVADKVTGKDSGQTPIGKEVTDFANNSPAMGKEMVRPIVHPKDYLMEHPLNQALNIAGVIGGAASLVGKASPVVADIAETTANAMGRRASGFTKGLIKGKNFDKANDAVQWMLEKKIMTPRASVDEMLSRTRAAREEAWANMSKTLKEQNAGAKGALKPGAKPQLREQFLFNPKESIDNLEGLRPKAKNGKILTGGQYDQMNAQIDDAIETIKAHGERPIPWDEANDLKGNLHANWDTTKSNAVNDLKKRIHGTFNENMEAQMDTAAEARGGNTESFKSAKRDYGAAKTAEKALDNLRSSKAGNRIVGLTDTIAGVGGLAAHGAIGAGSVIAAKKLIEYLGLTTGATIAQKLSAIAAKAPQLLGSYAPIMQKALAAGGADLAFTHGIIATTDPNYRALVKGLEGN